MILRAVVAVFLFLPHVAWAAENEDYYDLVVGGEPWLRTMIAPLDESSDAAREATYKVYTQVFDFRGEYFLTKGVGGKYTHHRGLFIGWKDTLVGDADYDTWHMTNCYQAHVNWLSRTSEADSAFQNEIIEWRDNNHEPFISEIRKISAHRGENGMRIYDFQSLLSSLRGNIKLRGDLQHAGMQIRMADEVSEHEASTRYVLPEGARELEDDKVVGAWWVMGSVEIGGKRYWVIHMTAPGLVTGEPVYSIRRYARFGAFFEPDLEEELPLEVSFRIVLSQNELDREDCERLYAEYAKEYEE